ncbi:hypothetical protein GM609_09290 [Bombella sp. ESL0387]|nr:hypothetical protein [Bombella sp. ESL0387]
MNGVAPLSAIQSEFTILYDHQHEANWFRKLHSDFKNAQEESINNAKDWPCIAGVLAYDRPDIILLHRQVPILVIEETVEVPSGHNVGQRFARIAAAAEAGIPCVYFGPYVARKHGGKTAGPRYMNLRLFHALDAMIRITGTAVTTINWGVDQNCEVSRGYDKDNDMREYIRMFLDNYYKSNFSSLNQLILRSSVHQRLLCERNDFIETKIRKPDQYNSPPPSVEFMNISDFHSRFNQEILVDNTLFPISEIVREIVLYSIGMNRIRSDPYTGMSILYKYLYVEGHSHRALVLFFKNIKKSEWIDVNRNRKDIKIYTIAADAIVFSDGIITI